ncbi:MAG: formyltransferase family protein [Candidatus Omnitrophota bacterium]|nr:methionyl-tRNA formyltransferase [Candidatus Omnitrophota bacterium]
MKITVFTSNQPRHIALIEQMASIADEVFAIQECNTVFPGQREDFFKKTKVMQEYFSNVIEAEKTVFGLPRFLPANVCSMSIKLGDLNKLELDVLRPALESDFYIIFGSSFIKGELCEFLISRKALNIHMGLSPYYRGNSCNFWALFDGKPDYVGATIHLLSKGLDSGQMLFHALPGARKVDAFLLGMFAVKSAQEGLMAYLKKGTIFEIAPVEQDKNLAIKYTRNKDFTDEVALTYLKNQPIMEDIFNSLLCRDMSKFLRPYVY